VADRELDALVAEKVMGFEVGIYESYRGITGISYVCKDKYPSGEFDLPNYSTDIKAAWEVVEKFSDESFELDHFCDGVWTCKFRWVDDEGESEAEAKAKTAPRAICLAALKAMGVEV